MDGYDMILRGISTAENPDPLISYMTVYSISFSHKLFI
jgi:hypothetical protein